MSETNAWFGGGSSNVFRMIQVGGRSVECEGYSAVRKLAMELRVYRTAVRFHVATFLPFAPSGPDTYARCRCRPLVVRMPRATADSHSSP